MSQNGQHDEEATLADEERCSPLVFHRLDEVTEPIDPRISPFDRPSPAVLDKSYHEHQNQSDSPPKDPEYVKEKSEHSEHSEHSEPEPIYVCHQIIQLV